MASARIERLAVYPVKGAAAIEIDEAQMTPAGMKGDREFMIVRAQSDGSGAHRFVSQRDKKSASGPSQELLVLANIKPMLIHERICLTWQGKDEIFLPNEFDQKKEILVRVWDHLGHAVDQGDSLADWLSDHLGFGVRLVRAGKFFNRAVSQKYAPNQNRLLFQDAYPVHWVTQESVNELSQKAGQKISWRSFRPNILASGMPAQEEHLIATGEMAGILFSQPKPCDRCPVTMIDQESVFQQGPEPLRTLATYKRWRNKEGNVKVIFGENMAPLSSGMVRVGDPIVLISRREPALVYG